MAKKTSNPSSAKSSTASTPAAAATPLTTAAQPQPTAVAAKPTPVAARPEALTMAPSYDQVSRRAYEIFMARGAIHGRHLEDWYQAERELRLGRQ